MDKKRLLELFELYYKGAASAADTEELMLLLKELPDNEVMAILSNTWNRQDKNETFFGSGLREKLLSKLHLDKELNASIIPIDTRRKSWLLKFAAAAAIVLALSMTIFFLTRKENQEVVQGTEKSSPLHDVSPGGDKAVLTLDDGRKIILDTASNGALAQQEGTKVIKLDGQLTYNAEANSTQVLHNTITTPKGGQFQLELADGSKVWLNAASSLRYPTAFTGKERTVELTGEGYFEVAHNPSMPFHVKAGEMNIQVLGTHFNINSYEDEPVIRTTLIEGEVNVSKKEKAIKLSPGQQAVFDNTGELTLNKNVNTDEIIAWKEGYIHFENADLKTILRQVARWYDIEIVYEGFNSNQTFFVILKRSNSLRKLLESLQDNNIRYTIEGKKLIVRSN
jgi:ferric-dicitrate binding protein FerR (iron transport regulator)